MSRSEKMAQAMASAKASSSKPVVHMVEPLVEPVKAASPNAHKFAAAAKTAHRATAEELSAGDLSTPAVSVIKAPISNIVDGPFNSRTRYTEASIAEIAESLRQHGQMQPCPAYIENGRVVLIFGGRRRRGAVAAGLSTLDVVLQEKPEDGVALVMSFKENHDRQNQSVIDDAIAFSKALQLGVASNMQGLALALGVSPQTVTRTMDWFKLDEGVKGILINANAQPSARAISELALVGSQLTLTDQLKWAYRMCSEDFVLNDMIKARDQAKYERKLTAHAAQFIVKGKKVGSLTHRGDRLNLIVDIEDPAVRARLFLILKEATEKVTETSSPELN